MAKKSAAPTKTKSGAPSKTAQPPAPTPADGAAAGAAAAQAAAQGGGDPAVAGAGAAPSMVPPGGPPGAQPPPAPLNPGAQVPVAGAPGAAPAPAASAGPEQGPAGPVGAFATQPPGSMGARSDARSQINFKDLPPLGQAQAMGQSGIDPMAGNKMASQQLQSTLAQPPQDANGVPSAFSGPGVPPGLENLPHDFAALHGMIQPLTATMARGFSPGSSVGEHQQALNAASLARAHASEAGNRATAQIEHHRNKTMLAQHLAAMHAAGTLPTPEQVAMHAAAAQPQPAPQLQSLIGATPSATPGY